MDEGRYRGIKEGDGKVVAKDYSVQVKSILKRKEMQRGIDKKKV